MDNSTERIDQLPNEPQENGKACRDVTQGQAPQLSAKPLLNETQGQSHRNENGTTDLSPRSMFSADSNLAPVYNLILYTRDDADFSTEFSATLSGGKLVFSGQDLGPAVEKRWGDWDYEYWYSFNQEETAKLLAAINADRDPEAALLRAFGGPAGENNLRALCETRGILYKFTSYV